MIFPEITRISSDALKGAAVAYNQRFDKKMHYYNVVGEHSEATKQAAALYGCAGQTKAVVLMDKAPDTLHGLALSSTKRGIIRNWPDTGVVVSSVDPELTGKRALVALGLAPHVRIGEDTYLRVCGVVPCTYDGMVPYDLPLDRLIPAVIESGETMETRVMPRGRNVLAKRHVQEVSSAGILLENCRNKRVVYEVLRTGSDVETVKPSQVFLAIPDAVLPISERDGNGDALYLVPEYGILSVLDL